MSGPTCVVKEPLPAAAEPPRTVADDKVFISLVMKDCLRSVDRQKLWQNISSINGDPYGYMAVRLISESIDSKVIPPWLFLIRKDEDKWWLTPNMLGECIGTKDLSSHINPQLLANHQGEWCITRSHFRNAIMGFIAPAEQGENPLGLFLESDATTLSDWFFDSKYRDSKKGFSVKFSRQNAADYLLQMCMFGKIILEVSCDDFLRT